MKSTDGAVSAFVGGKNYEVNKKGIIDVPVEFQDTLYSFGFITVGKNTAPDEIEAVQISDQVVKPEQAKEEEPQSHEQALSDNVSAA